MEKASVKDRVKPLVGYVGHTATECANCLALAVKAYELGWDDAERDKRVKVAAKKIIKSIAGI